MPTCSAPSGIDRRLFQLRIKRLRQVDRRIADRAAGPVIEALAAPAALQLLEIGQHVGIAPAFEATLAPEIIVEAAAAHIDHGIDRGTAAQRLAAQDRQLPSVEAGFGIGLERPDIFGIGRDFGEGDRHAHERMIVAPPGLE
jgi:hypothetical protein